MVKSVIIDAETGDSATAGLAKVEVFGYRTPRRPFPEASTATVTESSISGETFTGRLSTRANARGHRFKVTLVTKRQNFREGVPMQGIEVEYVPTHWR